MSIYSLMEKDWETYCLMAGIMYVEEMTKPRIHKQIKTYKGKSKEYSCYHTLRLKCVSYEIIKKWFDITKKWEIKLKTKLIGESFKDIRKENYSGQYMFLFSPNWLYLIMKTVKSFPSQMLNEISIERLKNWKLGKNKYILNSSEIDSFFEQESMYKKLFSDKMLAAGAIVVSFDLEFRGVTTGRPSLCMSEKYKDFLGYLLEISNFWGWSTSNKLFPVSVEYSKKLGINASPQNEFRISSKKLKEIYNLAGPLCDPVKDKAISFHAERSSSFVNLGGAFRSGESKNKIYNLLKNIGPSKITELQYGVNLGVDVILRHLNKLEEEGKVIKERKGKRYIWEIKNAD